MLEVTDRAAAALRGALVINKAGADRAIRLLARPENPISMEVDRPRAGDEVVLDEDRPVLIAAPEVAAVLRGMRLDYSHGADEGEEPAGFVLGHTEA